MQTDYNQLRIDGDARIRLDQSIYANDTVNNPTHRGQLRHDLDNHNEYRSLTQASSKL